MNHSMKFFLYISLPSLALPSCNSFAMQNEAQDLLQASICHNVLQVKELISQKVDVNQINDLGQTSLMLSLCIGARTLDPKSAESMHEIASALLEAGAQVDALDHNGKTALHRAAEYGLSAMAKELLVHNANPNIADCNGQTPLDEAAMVLRYTPFKCRRQGAEEIIKLLIHPKEQH